ncbi:ADP-ribosyltransferase [Escherichia coli]|uniref:ADP-ribosyltransferase n=2 Tax=Escherichia coli TaxID=562 RepID=UPI000BE5AA7F|nr:ADP-ribosyltransferase [Escherichia coli]
MSIINSVHLRRAFGMHVSGDEMKEISKKYPNGNVKNADKNLKRDVKRIANTINSTNKSKCHEMARFLTSIKGTCYYTSFVQKSLDNYAIKHGRNIESRTINKNLNNHEELNNNANKNIGQSRQSHIYEHGLNKKNHSNEHEYANVFSNSSNESEYANVFSNSSNESEYANVFSNSSNESEYTTVSSNSSNEHEYANVFSKSAKSAIELYTGCEYRQLNDALRNSLPLNGTMQEIIKGLNEVFSKNPNFGSVLRTYRGVPHKTNLSDLKEGEVCTVKGYLSTSRNKDIANDFKGERGGELNVIFGRSHCDMSKYSELPYEEEELYPHGVKMRKLFQYDLGGVHINILEELNENPVSIRRVTSALDVAKVNQHSFSRKSGHL